MTAREGVAWIACAALAVALALSRCGQAGQVTITPGAVEAVEGADTSGTVDRARIEEIIDELDAGCGIWQNGPGE